MSIKITFNGATIIHPGAYSKTVVENLTGFPLQATGIVGVIGEAPGGEPRILDILTRDQIQAAKSRYKSGAIADCLDLLAAPGNDVRVPNGASQIVVYKTNLSTKSQAFLQNAVPANVLQIDSANWGVDENNINLLVSAGQVADADAVIEGTIVGPFTLAGGETLILDINGVTYTFTNTLAGSTTAAAMVTELNTDARWAPATAPVTAALNTLGTGVKITIDPVVVTGGELDYGYISVDATSTIDTILGITGTNRGVKGSRLITVTRGTTVEDIPEVGNRESMTVKYVGVGTSCLLDIQDIAGERRLQTTVTGAGADDLDLLLVDSQGVNQFTVQELVDQINTLAAYEATVLDTNPDRNVDELDYYNNLEVIDVAGVIYSDIADTVEQVNLVSQLVTATVISNAVRAIATFSTAKFLTGAVDGSSVNSDWVTGLVAFEQIRINSIVPLISADKGSLTIDSINAAVKTHVTKMWGTLGRSERQAFLSKLGTKTELKDAAKTQNSAYCSIFGQQVRVLDRFGDLQWKDPWALACIAAGVRSGTDVGEPLTYKVINVNDVRVNDSSWNPKTDFAEMLDAGVTIVEPLDTGGFRIVLDNTTYGVDANFVWNRGSVVEAGGYVAYDLRYNLELVFTGTKARTGTAEAIKNFIIARMTIYLNADIIVGDDLNDGLGFKNLSVSINGSTATINMAITPVQGIDFLLPTLYLQNIQQTAA